MPSRPEKCMVQIQGDRALTSDGDDRLGFMRTAQSLAQALTAGTSADGLVVGVIGKWGSGKSSLLNLAQAALISHQRVERPHVIEFKPWLIGDRQALMAGLFKELIAGIDRIEHENGDATGVTVRKVERATDAIRNFAGLLSDSGKVVKAAGPIPTGLPLIGSALEFVGNRFTKRDISLTKAKDKVCKRLRKLNKALVVVIDDLDRLEPAEIVEVLRLVRSVADFPHITYVLSYDKDIVAHAVRVAAKVENGHAFIEKIVQITIPVPLPEAFDLRRWFKLELTDMNLNLAADDERRIAEIIDRDGGRYLVTPRAVVRTLDSVRFHLSGLQEQVDVSDFIWLQLVKVGNPALHDWINAYLVEISARASGRVHVSDESIARSRTTLDAALQAEAVTFKEICGRLADHLPGVAPYHQDAQGGIFEDVERGEINRAISGRRLQSPDHYRLYFAFDQPVNAPRTTHFVALDEAVATSAEATAALLRQWHQQALTSGVSLAEVMLDRFAAAGLVSLTPDKAVNLLLAFSVVMDDLGRNSVNEFGGPDVWQRANRALITLLDALGEHREDVLRRMFKEGTAISWLTSVFRHEIFAHGRHGDRPTSDRLLTAEELDMVTDIMVDRYQQMTLADVANSLMPLSMLFAWQQGGDDIGPRNLLSAAAETDQGLIDVLEIISGRVRTSTTTGMREYATLSRSNIQTLVDYEVTRARIEQLAAEAPDPSLRVRAIALRENFRNGDRF